MSHEAMADQRLGGNGSSLGVGAPRVQRADRGRDPAGGQYSLFDLFGGELGQRAGDGIDVFRGPQRVDERGPVPRVVRVRSHPAVRRRPEPRQRSERRSRGMSRHAEITFAANGVGNMRAIEMHGPKPPTAPLRQGRGREERDADARDPRPLPPEMPTRDVRLSP